MVFVYLILAKPNYSLSYVGWTIDLKKRIKLHNEGKGAKFTRGRKWKLVYYEVLNNKSEALKREFELKKDRKLRNYIKKMYFKKNVLNEK
ncbi:GIY-YIG nuclease family protein, partial [Candidatus Pelagibacter sp.]|jgi:putative endonuclease|nr:GIY-YIG nuclease family protein [Candidatus Pelagibacter sp.]